MTEVEVTVHNSIICNFIVDRDRLLTNLLQLFAHSQDSEWFSTIFAIIFEDDIVAEQRKKTYWRIIFCLLHKFAFPSTLLLPPALQLLRLLPVFYLIPPINIATPQRRLSKSVFFKPFLGVKMTP